MQVIERECHHGITIYGVDDSAVGCALCCGRPEGRTQRTEAMEAGERYSRDQVDQLVAIHPGTEGSETRRIAHVQLRDLAVLWGRTEFGITNKWMRQHYDVFPARLESDLEHRNGYLG